MPRSTIVTVAIAYILGLFVGVLATLGVVYHWGD